MHAGKCKFMMVMVDPSDPACQFQLMMVINVTQGRDTITVTGLFQLFFLKLLPNQVSHGLRAVGISMFSNKIVK
jgi:hypothetical protein